MTPSRQHRWRSSVARWPRRRLGSLRYATPALGSVAVLLVAEAVIHPAALAPSGWGALIEGCVPLVLLSMAEVPAVVSGRVGIDLSVGPLAGLVNAVIVSLHVSGAAGGVAVVAVALGMGIGSGLVNGLLVAYVRIPAVVATLGTYLVYTGLTVQVLPQAGGSSPGWLSALTGNGDALPLLVCTLVPFGALWLALRRSGYGRNLYAEGSDERAAYSAGVQVAHVRLIAYCLTGLVAGVCGLALTSVLGSGDPNVGSTFTLEAVAGVALGGVALSGGQGGMLGAAAGGATLFLLEDVLSLGSVGQDALDVLYGAIVVLAVAANAGLSMRRRRRLEGGAGVGEDALAGAGVAGDPA